MKCASAFTLAMLLIATAASVEAQVRPDASWRQLETQNFTIIYEDGLDSIARHAAERAELEHARLSAGLVRAPEGRIDIVIADNMDQSNGNARPFPNSRVTIWVRPPVEELSLQNYDDWTDLVITHELTHIFHLDPAGRVGRGLRAAFGRVPFPWPFFPILGTPRWNTEGLATLIESRHTSAGRLQGNYHEMVARTAILEHAFPTIDRVSGDSPIWPGRNHAYIYGSLLMDYIARRFGPEAHREIIAKSAGSLLPPPWRMDAIAKRAVGRSFTDIYADWRAELETLYGAMRDSLSAQGLTQGERITTTGRWALHPRISPDGRKLAYADENGRDVTATRIIDLATGADERIRLNGIGRAAWLTDSGLLVGQLDFADRYSIHSDLYVQRADGTERLTHGARAESPDVSADGRRIVYVQNVNGSNRLVVRETASGAERVVAEASPDAHWILPRWSPDGRSIAVQRWTRDRGQDVVVLMADGGEVTTVRTPGTDGAPAWSPDGRYLLFTSDRTGINNIYAFPVDGVNVLQVTNVLTGAFYPDVSPDGKWIYYSGYHADGFHIERIPFDPATWRAMMPGAPANARRIPAAVPLPSVQETRIGAGKAYSALPSLLPKYWVPAFDFDDVSGEFLGVATSGEDAVGRHTYGAMLAVDPWRGRTAADISYSYAGLGNPVVSVQASRLWDNTGIVGIRNDAGEISDTANSYDREDRLAVSASFVNRGWRASHAFTAGLEAVDIHRKTTHAVQFTDPRDRMLGLLAGASFAKYEYPALAISAEDGVRASAVARQRFEIDPSPGRDESYREVNAMAAAYKSLGGTSFAHSVLAARVSAVHRDRIGPGPTDIGGAGGFLPLRGYTDNARVGFTAWTASLEYRMPVRLIARGYNLRPLFIDRVGAAFFLDAGNAACSDAERAVYVQCAGNPQRPRDVLVAAGFELNANIAVLSFLPTWTRAGIGFPIGGESRTAQAYLTLAPAF